MILAFIHNFFFEETMSGCAIKLQLSRDDNYSQCRLNCPGPDEGDWDCNGGGGDDGGFMTPEEQEIQAALYAGLLQACIDLGPTVCTVFQVKVPQAVL